MRRARFGLVAARRASAFTGFLARQNRSFRFCDVWSICAWGRLRMLWLRGGREGASWPRQLLGRPWRTSARTPWARTMRNGAQCPPDRTGEGADPRSSERVPHLTAIQAASQSVSRPVTEQAEAATISLNLLVSRAGLEPATLCLKGRCSAD